MKLTAISAFSLLIAAGFGGAASAAPAYTFTSAPTSEDTQLSLGFTFTANQNLTVSSLGYFDDGGDGFLTAHEVGIYAGDGGDGPSSLLASTTLGAGQSGALGANDFRYQSIAPLALVAGQTYTITGLSPNTDGLNDPWAYGGPNEVTGFAVDPAISIGLNAARYTYNPGGLVDPSSHYSDYRFYAVNFAAGVPEPATWAVMLFGVAAAGAALRAGRRAPIAIT
ncbi:MAG TPA: PEPxxWA-CTERM sorting domain-containing protein [Caulobacteraceae bacterium]|jgi:hypothetical protein